MKLYVMRHGPAEDVASTGRDADRALTSSGRERVHAVAKALLEADEAPRAIISSSLVRALQTAEIVSSVTHLGDPIEIRSEMAPNGDVDALVRELFAASRKRVMIVGHEPDLSDLVMALVGTLPRDGMQKGMVVGLKLAPGADNSRYQAKLRFILDPKSVRFEW